jgi:HAD superfamily hydrolase (TIGR01509 family)
MTAASKAPAPAARILLVGMMGSGKTTVGRLLAERLGAVYRDNDESLATRLGGGPGAVQSAVGTQALHAAERAALLSALAADAQAGARGRATVTAAPASAVLDPAMRDGLRVWDSVVWLRARPETLAARLREDDGRPRFAPDMAAWLQGECATRAPMYRDIASLVVDVDDRSPWRIVQEILDGLSLGLFGWLPGAYAGVVFDLDGLLVDTETIWREAKRILYAERGVPFSMDDHRAVFGTSEEYTTQVFCRRFGLGADHYQEVRDAYMGHAEALFSQGVAVLPGARELVGSLRGRVPVGLASNTRRGLVDLILDRAGLTGCFDVVVTSDDAAPKPDPQIYRLASERLGAPPERSVAVEDSPTGVQAARSAGLSCIGVPSDPDVALSGADRIVGSLVDLIEPSQLSSVLP